MIPKANQALDEKDLEITPQARQRQKISVEHAEHKKNAKVVEKYLEVISDHQHKKGGKVRLCQRMNNGNLHRLYLGREKQVATLLEKYKKQGLKVVR